MRSEVWGAEVLRGLSVDSVVKECAPIHNCNEYLLCVQGFIEVVALGLLLGPNG